MTEQKRLCPVPFVAGQRFGRWTTLSEEPRGPQGRMVACRCDCGTVATVVYKSIRSGNKSSCGCLRREMVAAKNRKHGCAQRAGRLPEYWIWKRMRQRCNDPNNHEWDRYGGRGIAVDHKWDDFAAFLNDLGRRPSPRHSLERIDNDAPYMPGNVRWATASEQARNKRNTRWVDHQGRRWCLADLAETYSVPYGRLRTRLEKGWPLERALTEPIHKVGKQR